MASARRSSFKHGAILLFTIASVVFAGRAIFKAVRGPARPSYVPSAAPSRDGDWSGRGRMLPKRLDSDGLRETTVGASNGNNSTRELQYESK